MFLIYGSEIGLHGTISGACSSCLPCSYRKQNAASWSWWLRGPLLQPPAAEGSRRKLRSWMKQCTDGLFQGCGHSKKGIFASSTLHCALNAAEPSQRIQIYAVPAHVLDISNVATRGAKILWINIADLNVIKWDFGNSVSIKNALNKGLLTAHNFYLRNPNHFLNNSGAIVPVPTRGGLSLPQRACSLSKLYSKNYTVSDRWVGSWYFFLLRLPLMLNWTSANLWMSTCMTECFYPSAESILRQCLFKSSRFSRIAGCSRLLNISIQWITTQLMSTNSNSQYLTCLILGIDHYFFTKLLKFKLQ